MKNKKDLKIKKINLSQVNVNEATPWLRKHYNPTVSEVGIKAVKKENRPLERKQFDKTGAITPYNFPLSKFTKWFAFGYKTNKFGIKRPYWIDKILPTGHAFLPDLDEVITVRHHQIF